LTRNEKKARRIVKRPRIENIQALRGVAALMVLAAHIWGADADYGGAEVLPDHLRIGVAGVDLFFLISGFVMIHVAGRMASGRGPALRFLYNRGARIYPLYWIATITMIVFYLGKAQFFGEATETGGPIRSFLLLPQPAFPILSVGWTLVHEVYFYLIFSLILLTAPARRFSLLGLWGAIVALANLAGAVDTNAWTALAFSPLTFEFLAGAGIAIALDRTSTGFGRKWGLPALGAGAALFAAQTFMFDDHRWIAMNDHGARAFAYTAPFALMLYGAAAVERMRGIAAPRWLIAAGDASYSLYLFHLPLILMTGKLISVMLGDRGFIDNLAIIVICIGVCLLAAFIIHRTIERPALKLTKRLGDRVIEAKNPVWRQERIW